MRQSSGRQLQPAVEKPLLRAARRSVSLANRFHEAKLLPEHRAERVRRVALDGQSAALGWPVVGERRNDHMPARLDGTANLRDVRRTILRSDEEMKYGAVVPEVDARRGEVDGQDVRLSPHHCLCTLAQSLARS